MGMALAQDQVESGWKVATADRNETRNWRKNLEMTPPFTSQTLQTTNSTRTSSRKFWGKYGRIDALCANNGIVDKKIPPKLDLQCTDLAIHFMRKNKIFSGKIVATASVAGIILMRVIQDITGQKAAIGVINFIRGRARVLQDISVANKENIAINAVCPSIFHTSSLLQAIIDAISSKCLTPPPTIVAAYERYLDDGSIFGEAGNGRVSTRAITVWHALFKIHHRENSGLPGAVP
ncbi:hypothetical protein K469DRAFT_735660 [Zopfia rhizophila CBS 207.26]|uniref:NAD(P)-binding protein n=1 Tax=Zopfia rhizophila CBS 207.26 TaxID=1314779 RepID=A0A6A6ENM1_9PEZI|nr:hypothetical protein K469DRAFT_735660 [Zopfia rhizophila CBS 207.26]